MQLGTGEIIMLVVVLMIVLSASRMSALGNAVGKFVYSFRKAAKGEDLIDVTPRRVERGTVEGELVDKDRRPGA